MTDLEPLERYRLPWRIASLWPALPGWRRRWCRRPGRDTKGCQRLLGSGSRRFRPHKRGLEWTIKEIRLRRASKNWSSLLLLLSYQSVRHRPPPIRRRTSRCRRSPTDATWPTSTNCQGRSTSPTEGYDDDPNGSSATLRSDNNTLWSWMAHWLVGLHLPPVRPPTKPPIDRDDPTHDAPSSSRPNPPPPPASWGSRRWGFTTLDQPIDWPQENDPREARNKQKNMKYSLFLSNKNHGRQGIIISTSHFPLAAKSGRDRVHIQVIIQKTKKG